MASLDGKHFDAVILGAGMSGLAAGIRAAHFGQNTLIVERHNAPGGLNSFYSLDGRRYDVGLHAMTNYVPPGVKGAPLVKLLRQLRLSREDFDLAEQNGSRIVVGDRSLAFNNDFSLLESEIAREFPQQIDGFLTLDAAVRSFPDTDLDQPFLSARAVLARHLTDPVLIEMLLLPLLYYGSSREDDIDFAQFAIMYKAIFREGFARPYDGVRRIIRALTDRYRELGGIRKMKCGVQSIEHDGRAVRALRLDDGSRITAGQVVSSAGWLETLALCEPSLSDGPADNQGKLSFVETITVLDCQPATLGWEDTIVFFNEDENVRYRCPDERTDGRSGVICFPNNYRYSEGRILEEGWLRVTALASYDRWAKLQDEAYQRAKTEDYDHLLRQALRFLPDVPEATVRQHTVATDMFTPLTVERFTGHRGGAIYGSRDKNRRGLTPLENLHLCGTDQGFLGITGAMLSGISMANLHLLGGSTG